MAVKPNTDIEIHHLTVSVFVLSVIVCSGGGGGGSECLTKENKKKEGLGWALSLASLSSLEVECLSSPSPPLRAAGPRSGNKTG